MSATADFVIRNRALQRYILANEKIIIATHRHWAMLWEPILTTVGSFVLAVTILVAVDPDVRDDLAWVWLPFLVLGARLVYKWLAWRAEWFVMTDRRLLLLTGLLVHRVSMMPSDKVTDLGYERTPLGQLLGYGTFIFETAGQDQALERATWIPRPDSRYRLIIATLFHPDAADAEAAAQSNPEIRPQAAPSADSSSSTASAAPPALMPRIGRRSNPPTQRIELPIVRDGAAAGSTISGSTAPANVGQESTAQDKTVPNSEDPTGVTWSTTGGAAAPAASGDASTDRARDGAGGEHVPGGPTADLDAAEARPNPFIEGGKDPKIR